MAATLKCDTIQNASSSTANLTLDASGNATVGNTLAMGSSFKRNKIINGDMRVDQRNAGASVTPTSGAYFLDRWNCEHAQASKYSVQQNAGAVTPPAGFTNYLGATSLSAYTLGATDYFQIKHRIEGYNVADLAWGTASAKTITISFQVYSSLTGTFSGCLLNSAANRSYAFSYSVASANTWTTVSITIPGDTSGTWVKDNGMGLEIRFNLGVGSTYSVSSSGWSSSLQLAITGSQSIVSTNAATWYITGVQLEVGSVATPYERQIYSDQLAQCQRYCYVIAGGAVGNNYQRIGTGPGQGTTSADIQIPIKVSMRIAPSFTATAANTFALYDGATVTPCTTVAQDGATTANMPVAGIATASGLSSGKFYEFIFNNTTSGSLTLSAEL